MAQWVTERLYGGVGDNELDGGGLIQRKGSSRAIQRKSWPRERPVIQVRVREQRSVKAPERLDPGADLVRKLQMQAEAAMGLAPVAPRCQPWRPRAGLWVRATAGMRWPHSDKQEASPC